MTGTTDLHGIAVAAPLADFMEREVLTLGIGPDAFWSGYAAMLRDLMPENRRLLSVRDDLQERIDDWHRANRPCFDPDAYCAFLAGIGYLVADPGPVAITTEGVDPEIAAMSGPQLVVPATNARFALNAANARWGSLYDALYGTDATPGRPATDGFDRDRADAVVAWAKAHLDAALPLENAVWRDVTRIAILGNHLHLSADARVLALRDPKAFVGHRIHGAALAAMFRVNGLGIELVIDPSAPVGRGDPAAIADIRLEAALTAIVDCEDSVACVDADDKVAAWRNWLGLMRGDLAETFQKNGRSVTRRLAEDFDIVTPDGTRATCRGRALLLVRNVGHLMTTDAVTLDGDETPEGILDAAVTVACALHDLRRGEGPRNSATGSIYIVKPKMHGPEEVAFAVRTLEAVERLLHLPPRTVRLGLMDEERRTSANLRACMAAARDRLVFINTGFLDRTGDEIHTSMQAGPVVPKAEMRAATWLGAYENGNVDAGLAMGLPGRGQIGKGMWAKPDAMAAMLAEKAAHPHAGASTAWVPSPTAATLHATHYHRIDVAARQRDLRDRVPAARAALLTPPLLHGRNLDPAVLRRALDEAAQSILGYVVRWIDQGIGCSKVPDLDDVGLMEDRATLRISAQLLANWLMHDLLSRAGIEDALRRMARRVDAQNAGDPLYRPMAPGFDGPAFLAARALILDGAAQPSGYTEPLLHAWRRRAKTQERTG